MEHDRILLQLIEEVLKKMGTPASNIELQEEEGNYRVNIESDEANLLIGFHGETIRALEHAIRLIFWKKAENPEKNVIIDIQNYRKRQEESVIEMAIRKAEFVKKMGKPQTLPPMSPYFRRVVHMHLNEKFSDLETVSVGEGDRRQITIKVKGA
ncbi:MAG: R3H domain-containing nucleic acid-binding protein [Patescibacteria group bacterium]